MIANSAGCRIVHRSCPHDEFVVSALYSRRCQGPRLVHVLCRRTILNVFELHYAVVYRGLEWKDGMTEETSEFFFPEGRSSSIRNAR
jgi:hypothetical protein